MLRFISLFTVFKIPQRYILGIMGFLAVVNAYIMRVILSVAITEMVEMIPSAHEHNTSTSCVYEIANKTVLSVKVRWNVFLYIPVTYFVLAISFEKVTIFHGKCQLRLFLL